MSSKTPEKASEKASEKAPRRVVRVFVLEREVVETKGKRGRVYKGRGGTIARVCEVDANALHTLESSAPLNAWEATLWLAGKIQEGM